MIEFKIDTSAVSRHLHYLAFDQMPFAMARALTRVAQDAQIEVRRGLPHKFTIRNKFVQGGIRITSANKRKLESSVYSKDDFMGLQESGGSKRAKGRNLAIPASSRGTTHVRKGKNTHGVIDRSLKPGKLTDKKLYFKGTINNVYGIWKRTGERDGKGWPRPHLNLMYALTPITRVKPRFEFENTVRKTARERMARQMELAMAEALRSAR